MANSPNEGDDGRPEKQYRTRRFAMDETLEHRPRERQESILCGVGGRVFHSGLCLSTVLSEVYFYKKTRTCRFDNFNIRIQSLGR